MRRFIELPYEERKQMGVLGRQRMVEIFDKNKVVEKTLKEIGL